MYIYSKTIKFFLFTLLFILLINNYSSYAKNIDLNGINIDLKIEVTKEPVNIGKSVNAEKYSNTENEEEKKNFIDKYVNVELKIKNNNPYEAANITIKESVNSGFKQVGANSVGRKESFKLKSNEEKIYKYDYKYQKNFLLEQINNILHNEDEDSVGNNSDKNSIYEEGKDFRLNDENKNITIEEKKSNKKHRGIGLIIAILVALFIAAGVLYMFIIFIRIVRDQDIDFDSYGKYYSFILFLIITFLINIIYSKNTYATNYTPILYEKGESYTKIVTETVVFNERYYNFSYEISVKYENKNEINNYEVDTDLDGLSDAVEYLYMTDISNVDSDEDGLSDYLEVMVLNYNPNSKWTFNDGRNDGFRDYDEDGLRNIKEVELGTDLTLHDTDFDNLGDYEEVNGIMSKDGKETYFTNPLKEDTDDDGLNDDVEIKLGLNPTNPMTDGIVIDSEKKIKQEYDIHLVPSNLREGDIYINNIKSLTSGDINENIKISNYYNENLLNVNAIVSSLFKVENSNKDTLEITLNVSKVAERKNKLVIVKIVDGVFEAKETEFNGDNISATIDSNGIYGVVDSEIILKDLGIYIENYM